MRWWPASAKCWTTCSRRCVYPVDVWFSNGAAAYAALLPPHKLTHTTLIYTQTLSLRTALVVTACTALTDAVSILTRQLDAVAEPMVMTLIKIISSTKKLVHSSGSQCLAAVLVCTSLKPRVLDRIAVLADDKNAQVRTYAAMLMHELLLTAANGGYPHDAIGKLNDPADRAIKRGAADSNATVREIARDAFYLLERLAPVRAAAIQGKLDPNTRKALAKGPSKPRGSMLAPQLQSVASLGGAPTAGSASASASHLPAPTRVATAPAAVAASPPGGSRHTPSSPLSSSPRTSSFGNDGYGYNGNNHSHGSSSGYGQSQSHGGPVTVTGGAFAAAMSPLAATASRAMTTPLPHSPVPMDSSPYSDDDQYGGPGDTSELLGAGGSSSNGGGGTGGGDTDQEVDDNDLTVWLEAFDDAVAVGETGNATDYLAYMLDAFSQATGSVRAAGGAATASTAGTDAVLDAMAPPLRSAVLAALASGTPALAVAALDDPSVLWAAFGTSADDAVDLVVALADARATSEGILDPMVDDTVNDARVRIFAGRTPPHSPTDWVRVLSCAADSVANPTAASLIARWARDVVDPQTLAAWASGAGGAAVSEDERRLALRVLEIEQEAASAAATSGGGDNGATDIDHDPSVPLARSGVPASRDRLMVGVPPIEDLDEPPGPRVVSPMAPSPSPPRPSNDSGSHASAQEDPVEELILALADTRVTIVELYRYTALVRSRPGMVTADAILDQVAQLLEYAVATAPPPAPAPSADTSSHSGGDEGAPDQSYVSTDNDAATDLSAECVLAAHHVLGSPTLYERKADALAVVLRSAAKVDPTAPLAYWFDQCVGDLVSDDPVVYLPHLVRATAALATESSTTSTSGFATLCGYTARLVESLGADVSRPVSMMPPTSPQAPSNAATPLSPTSTSSAGAIAAVRDHGIDAIVAAAMRAPASAAYVRLAGVKLAVGVVRALGSRVLDDWVARGTLDAAHRRIVVGYMTRTGTGGVPLAPDGIAAAIAAAAAAQH
ncbi:clasp N terminal-domain-containing protein [Blastocladiella britannica]|nr:clasp N terminal-domain-containing protein [Blastocladiella britannica]